VDYASCPTEVVNSPIEVVWNLLTNPAGWGGFFDLRVLGVEPAGQAQVGQRVRAETGPRSLHLKVGFKFTEIDAERHRLGFDVELPFGIKVREEMDCALVSAGSCRVNYHCNFEFPSGIRGRALRLLVRRGLDSGPRDSLQRLKRAAEAGVGEGHRA
jgi:hypothetical protein